MKLFATSILGLALIASPALAQPDNTMTNEPQATTTHSTHVRTTTKHVRATNVPVRHHTTKHRRHHAMRCSCPTKAHHAKTHHVVKKSTTTTKS